MNIEPKHPYVTPAPGFNPLTASPAELHQHYFPQKPSGGRALSLWTKMANGYMAGTVVQCAPALPSQQPAWVKRIGHHLG